MFAPAWACHSKGVLLETSRRPVVLAVEDEPLVLMLALDMIRDAGFEPLWGLNGDEAIRTLKSRNDIRIVFTDINMPGSMDGIKLARAGGDDGLRLRSSSHRVQRERAEAVARGQPVHPQAL